VRFGAFLLAPQYPGQDHGTVLDATVAAAVAADEAGFDEVWVAEHHFISYGVCPSAVTLAGYLLAATRRVAVGTAVSVLSTAHPVALAEQTALLDQLSGGRFRLGVGRGGPWVDLDVFDTGLGRWEHGYPAALDVLLETLRTGRVADDLPLVPAPRTRPHPPVVTAVTSQGGLAVAAERRLPMLLGMHADDAEKATFTARYAALTDGFDPGHLAAGVAHVADTRTEALAELRAALPRWLGPGVAGYQRADGAPHTSRDPHAYTELLCRLHPIGSPEDCIRRLTRTVARTAIRHHLLLVETTGDAARTQENIARLGTEVLPRLRNGAARRDIDIPVPGMLGTQ
jgi:alkanesulfonate monooxygenase SsuD/methylene tetrahydromethanopterin reductase-like flavin-dependent oxidoreductase (luciferase family)